MKSTSLDGQDYAVDGVYEGLKEQAGGFENVDFFYVIDATGKYYKKRMARNLLKKFKTRIENDETSEVKAER